MKVIIQRESKTVYDLGDRISKVFDPDYSKANVFNEALNTARVEETGLPIPRVLSVSLKETGIELELEKKQGETLESLMKKYPEKREEYLKKFVSIQREIHEKKAPLLNKIKEKYYGIIDALDCIDKDTKYELAIRLNSMKNHTKLLHGDFVPSNILIDENGNHTILDWAHASQGNASADAAMSYILLYFEDEDLAKAYLEEFSKQTGIGKRIIYLWIPIIAAVRLAKAKGEEREKLLSFIEVFDFQ